MHCLMKCNLFELDGKAFVSAAEKISQTLTPYPKLNNLYIYHDHTIISVIAKYTYACFEKKVD